MEAVTEEITEKTEALEEAEAEAEAPEEAEAEAGLADLQDYQQGRRP